MPTPPSGHPDQIRGSTQIKVNTTSLDRLVQASTVTLLGNPTGSTANVQEITLGTGLEFSGNTLQTTAGSGPRTIFVHYTDAGNVGTGEDDLYSDSIAGNTLANNGESLSVVYAGTFVSSITATRELRVYFAGTLIFDVGALNISASEQWSVHITIMRASSSSVRCEIIIHTGLDGDPIFNAYDEITGLDLTTANILKITGQSAGSGVADNDIVAGMGRCIWYPAP